MLVVRKRDRPTAHSLAGCRMHGKRPENQAAARRLLKTASSRDLSIGVQVLWIVFGCAWRVEHLSLTGKPQHGGRGRLTKLVCVEATACSACPAKDAHDFETGDAGAAHTYPQQALKFHVTETARAHDEYPVAHHVLQAGEVRKGSHLMIKGRPCKCPCCKCGSQNLSGNERRACLAKVRRGLYLQDRKARARKGPHRGH